MGPLRIPVLCAACCWAAVSAWDISPVFAQAVVPPPAELKMNGITPGIPLLLLRHGTVPPPPECSPIPNGNFESGHTVWTEYSSHGWDIISTTFPGGVLPHGGSYAAWLGGDYDDVSYLEQQVAVPSTCPFLLLYHWIASQDNCGFDYGYVRINGTSVQTFELCDVNNTGGWVAQAINVSAYAGQTVTLQIRAETDAARNSNWFIDDVSFAMAP